MLITLVLLCTYVLKLVKDYSLNERSTDILTKANIMAGIASQVDFEHSGDIKSMRSGAEIAGNARVFYIDRDAKVLFDSSSVSSLVGKTVVIQQVANALAGEESAQPATENDKMFVTAAVPVISEETVTGAIYMQSPADDMYNFFAHMRNKLIIISAILCIVTALLSLLTANGVTSPLSAMAAKIRAMSENETKKPIELQSTNEVNALVDEFNKMVEQINIVEGRRQEFVSNASHELKTPLASVKLICDSILQNPDVSMDVVNEFLCDMNDEVDRLTRITNKLLSLTKMDASAEETEMMELSVINLKGLMRRIVKSLRPLAESKHIELETLLNEDVYATVDADKLWEAVYNIAENSIKYTSDNGWVYVEMYRDKQEVFITVADNGIGMCEEETEKIFDRFYRVDKARARETGGNGLGLAIARSSVELHGGNISVESYEGEGSLFRIIIPTVASTPAVQSKEEEEEAE